MSERGPGGGGESEFDRKKREINLRLRSLLGPGAPLAEIARMLGAEDLLQTQPGRGKEPVLRFDVRAYVQREAEKSASLRLPDEFIKLKTTVLPPDKGETIKPGSGKGVEAKQIIPRSRYLAEVLTELNQPYRVVTGTNRPNMVRRESYQAFVVSGLARIVLVNDEEGNVTIVIHSAQEGEHEVLMEMTKDELRDLGEEKVQPFDYPGDVEQYKVKLKELLTMEFRKGKSSPDNPFVRVEGEKGEIELAPPGWKHELGVSLYLGVSRKRVAALIERVMEDHLPQSKTYRNEKGQALKYYSPDLIEHVRKVLEQELTPAPDGWRTYNQLADELNVNPQTTERLINAYHETHPESVVSYMGEWGRVGKFASPELVRIVRENIGLRVKPPEGWKIAGELIDLSRAIRTDDVRAMAEAQRMEHPEWFKRYANKQRMLEDHFHPELVAFIEREIAEKPERAPAGWMGVKPLADELGVDSSMVKRIAEIQTQTHPDWMHFYIGLGGVAKHMHPELVAIIRKEISGRSVPPEGWKGLTSISEEANVDPITIRRLIARTYDSYRQSNPEWFGMYSSPNGKEAEFFHPELVQMIVNELRKRELAPEGWRNVLAFSNEMKAEMERTGQKMVFSRNEVKRAAEAHRSTHPEWFRKFKAASGTGPFVEHYHPDLLKLLKEELKR